MDYCKKCKNSGCNAAGTERTTTDCEDYMSHLPTNADRIRAMTDEELASLLMYFADDTDGIDEKDYDAFGDMEWRERMLRWLKKEADHA